MGKSQLNNSMGRSLMRRDTSNKKGKSQLKTNPNTFFVEQKSECRRGCLQIEHRMAGKNFPQALLNRQCLDITLNARIDPTVSINNFCNPNTITQGTSAIESWLTPNTDGYVDFKFQNTIQLESFANQFNGDYQWKNDCAEGTGDQTTNICYVNVDQNGINQKIGDTVKEGVNGLSASQADNVLNLLKTKCISNNKCVQNKVLNLCDGMSIEMTTVDKVCFWRFGMFSDCYANVNNINTQVEVNTSDTAAVVSHVGTAYEINVSL